MFFNYSLFFQYYPLFLKGIGYSLLVSVGAFCIGITGGTILGFILTQKQSIAQYVGLIYVLVFRGTPMIIQLLMLYCLFPLLGIEIPAIFVAIISIGLNSIAYMSQVIKTGIMSVARGEREAAYTLGFSEWQINRYIIFPQAFKNSFPAFVSESITLMKDSALAHIIGVTELTFEANLLIAKTYDAISVYLIVGILYLLMTGMISILFYLYERKLYASYYE